MPNRGQIGLPSLSLSVSLFSLFFPRPRKRDSPGGGNLLLAVARDIHIILLQFALTVYRPVFSGILERFALGKKDSDYVYALTLYWRLD